MVIVESVALAIMVSNDIVMPLVLQAARGADHRPRRRRRAAADGAAGRDLRHPAASPTSTTARPATRSSPPSGCLSFAAIAQLAPAFFGGLIWRRATARGAIAGMTIGILVWAYTLLLPSFADAGIVGQQHPQRRARGASTLLRPQALFGLDLPPLVHGVVWSLALNVLAYVGFSLGRAPASIERLQADLFVPSDLAPIAPSFRLWRSVGDGRGTDHDRRPLSRRGAHAHLVRQLRLDPRHQPRSARPRPTSSCCATPSICSPRRSAPPPRGSCCRCCCASARCRPRPRSSCSTTPTRRSTTTAKSCRPRSTTCARASRSSTRTCSWSAGTGSSAKSSTCRRSSPASAPALDEILRFNAEHGALGHGADRGARARAARALRRRAASRSSSASPSATW